MRKPWILILLLAANAASYADDSPLANDLWVLRVRDGETFKGQWTIPAESALAQEVGARAGIAGKASEQDDVDQTVVVASRLRRLHFSKSIVVIEERDSDDAAWRQSVREAASQDLALRDHLLSAPRFDTADFVEVVEYRGKFKPPPGDDEVRAVEFRVLKAPAVDVPERKRRLLMPTSDIESFDAKEGEVRLLLRLHPYHRDWRYQAFEYDGKVRELIEGAPPVPEMFSKDPADQERDLAQARYYFHRVGDSDPMVAGISALAVAGLGSETLLSIGLESDAETLRRMAANPRWTLETQAAFAMMLAAHRRENDASFVFDLLNRSMESDTDGARFGLGLAYSWIARDKAFDVIEDRIARSELPRSETWTQELVILTRQLSHMPECVSRDRILSFLRKRLDEPMHFDMVVGDLASWKDWDQQDALRKRFDGAANHEQREIVRYFLASIEDQSSSAAPGQAPHQIKGRQILEQLRGQKPDLVGDVERQEEEFKKELQKP